MQEWTKTTTPKHTNKSSPSFSITYSFSPCRKWFLVNSNMRPTRSVVEIPSVRLTSLENTEKQICLFDRKIRDCLLRFIQSNTHLYRFASFTIWYVSTPSAVVVMSSAIIIDVLKYIGYGSIIPLAYNSIYVLIYIINVCTKYSIHARGGPGFTIIGGRALFLWTCSIEFFQPINTISYVFDMPFYMILCWGDMSEWAKYCCYNHLQLVPVSLNLYYNRNYSTLLDMCSHHLYCLQIVCYRHATAESYDYITILNRLFA